MFHLLALFCEFVIKITTRMHSSRMRTVACSSRLLGGGGEVSGRGECLVGGCLVGGGGVCSLSLSVNKSFPIHTKIRKRLRKSFASDVVISSHEACLRFIYVRAKLNAKATSLQMGS